MVIIDTSVLFAFFNEADSQHKKSKKKMQEYIEKDEIFLVSELVLLEMVSIKSIRKLSIPQIDDFLDDVISEKLFQFQPYFFGKQEKISMFKKIPAYNNHRLSYVDLSLIYLKNKHNCSKLFSFDERLSRVAGKNLFNL